MSRDATQHPSVPMKRGGDSSCAQGVLDVFQWRSLRVDGHEADFWYHRCGNGNAVPDWTYKANLTACRRTGITVGAYHVVFPLRDNQAHPGRSPEEQAEVHFAACDGLGSEDGALPPMIDLEWPETSDWKHWGIDAQFIREHALRYLARARSLYRRVPVLYTYPDWWSRVSVGQDMAPFAAYRLCIADYADTPRVLAPWARETLWQSGGGTGRLPNGEPVDVTVFRGTDDEWQTLLGS